MSAAARLFFALIGFALLASAEAQTTCPDTLNFTVRQLGTDEVVNLCETYRGKVVLIVNTASKCAYTDQYEGLETLYEQYRDRGLVVLGFPSNDFGGQEPGTENEIKRFCRLTYSVKFPMFEKTHARKDRADPLYRLLGERAGEYPRWNFHKYLLDRDGRVAGSYRSSVHPQGSKLTDKIEALL